MAVRALHFQNENQHIFRSEHRKEHADKSRLEPLRADSVQHNLELSKVQLAARW